MEIEREDIIKELAEQFRPVMEQSPDGVYMWLDEAHKACNERLAEMFGFTVRGRGGAEPFLESLVAEEGRAIYSWNYHNRVAALAFRFRRLMKGGSVFFAETDMTPSPTGDTPSLIASRGGLERRFVSAIGRRERTFRHSGASCSV